MKENYYKNMKQKYKIKYEKNMNKIQKGYIIKNTKICKNITIQRKNYKNRNQNTCVWLEKKLKKIRNKKLFFV